MVHQFVTGFYHTNGETKNKTGEKHAALGRTDHLRLSVTDMINLVYVVANNNSNSTLNANQHPFMKHVVGVELKINEMCLRHSVGLVH